VGQTPLFKGVGVALITLFTEDLELDAAATADLAARLVDLGVKAVVVAGSTGEATALDPDERTELLLAVRKAVPEGSGAPLIAGTGAPSARQAARYTAAARYAGADAVLALSPPGSADPRRYYETVSAAAGDIPVLAYHFPKNSAPGIPVAALADLPISGLKDSSGDPGRLLETLNTWDRAIYCGSASLITLAGAAGGAGGILALANAEPEACAAAYAGDGATQVKMIKAIRTCEASFPAGIKSLVAARFGYSTSARLG
jgi:4-hydroxy-tetrahydrodipicolinate synthase